MPARDAAAVGLVLLTLANFGLFAQEITFSDAGHHYSAIATLLLRDDYVFPTQDFARLIGEYTRAGNYKYRFCDMKETPASQPNFHYISLTICLW